MTPRLLLVAGLLAAAAGAARADAVDTLKDFDLASLPAKDGLEWAQATPKSKDGAFPSVRLGFRGKELAAIEITDGFGQRSLLQFTQFAANAPVSPELFKFVVPKGADVIEQ